MKARERKNVWLTAIFTLLSVFALKAGSLSGSYTIAPSGADYSSFTDAVSALNTNGISGPVTFSISAGSYNENITIPAIKGSSATNTITFNGAGSGSSGTRIYYAASGAGAAVVYLNGCAWVSFSSMMIENTASSSGSITNYPAAVASSADNHISLLNCTVKSPVSGVYLSSFAVIKLLNSNYATISGCRIEGGLYGLYHESKSISSSIYYGNITVKDNRFVRSYFSFLYALAHSYGSRNDVYTGNSFDSASSMYITAVHLSYENGATFKNNNLAGNVQVYIGLEIDNPNYNSTSAAFNISNNFIGNFSFEGLYISASPASNINISLVHNTISDQLNNPYMMVYAYFTGSSGVTFKNNLLTTARSGVPLNLYTSATPKNISIDGNDYYTSGSTLLSWNGTPYGSIADFQGQSSNYAWSVHDQNSKPYFAGAKDYHLDAGYAQPFGTYAGIDEDADGVKRCSIFPTAGASESGYNPGSLAVKFTLPLVIYPNSPVNISQSAKKGEPKKHSWYLNGAFVSDSVNLFTNQFAAGPNTLKLVTEACNGKDSFSQTIYVNAPKAAPVSDYISDRNNILTGDVVKFTDLSTNGPIKWQWRITPDSLTVNGVKTQAYTWLKCGTNSQSPVVKFLYEGSYDVCLTAYNGIGKGQASCKKKYINVTQSVNLNSVSTVKAVKGYLYDNGGPNADYTYDAKTESIVIDPCADSVYLVFNSFDLYCGYDFIKIYEGTNNKGKLLTNSCKNYGISVPKGLSGGKAKPNCSYQCMPDLNKPDTFKAAGQMYIEMSCLAAYKSAGFEAHWWSKPKKGDKPTASFTSSAAGDSVCVNGIVNFTNTCKSNPADPTTCMWDLDGDLSNFECVGTCATAINTYYSEGPVQVTLIAANCGGADTMSKTITVFRPKAPKASIVADNQAPTTADYVFFSVQAKECIDHYKWVINKSKGAGKGSAAYMSGTSNTSPAPMVMFSDTGYYDVKLYYDNMNGMQKDSAIMYRYVHTRMPVCIPSSSNYDQGIGISKVAFGAMSNSSLQGTNDYTNYVNTHSLAITVEQGMSYALTISRNPALLSSPITRDVYIDWNQDGNFTGANENISRDSGSYNSDFKTIIKIPANAKTGATVIRIAANMSPYKNKPCGKNEFGEYEDYRLYITPYHTAPAITLKGTQGVHDTIFIEQGNDFAEPGAAASSTRFGDLTHNIIVTSRKAGSHNIRDSFNKMKPGTYIFYYNVKDSLGNAAAPKMRIVTVTPDRTAPALMVEIPDTVKIDIALAPYIAIPYPKVISCKDKIDGSTPVTIDTGMVNRNVPGIYPVKYSTEDKAGNKASVYRYIYIIDSIKPVIILNGGNMIRLQVYHTFADPGVQVKDNYYAAGQLKQNVLVYSTVDTAHIGTYTIVYEVTDPSGNVAVPVKRYVIVTDTIKPEFTIKGPAVDSIEVFASYADPGFTVKDNYDAANLLNMEVGGTFFAAFPKGKNASITGSYTITYTAEDVSGNKTVFTRIIKVQDRTAPVITLLGQYAISVCRWFSYTDSGYAATDNYDKISDLKIDTLGTFYRRGGTTMENFLYITYRATDRAGNVSYSETRYIDVKPETSPECFSGLKTGLPLEKYISVYPNPAKDIIHIKASPPENEHADMSLQDMTGRTLGHIYTGSLQNNIIDADLGDLSPGIYYINVITETQSARIKLEIVK